MKLKRRQDKIIEWYNVLIQIHTIKQYNINEWKWIKRGKKKVIGSFFWSWFGFCCCLNVWNAEDKLEIKMLRHTAQLYGRKKVACIPFEMLCEWGARDESTTTHVHKIHSHVYIYLHKTHTHTKQNNTLALSFAFFCLSQQHSHG